MFQCKFHNEPFTMFCTTKKTMLCIKCFRDTSMDARLHCVDLDTAYNQGAKKLERALVVRLSKQFLQLQHYEGNKSNYSQSKSCKIPCEMESFCSEPCSRN